jgi:hypothetical protein
MALWPKIVELCKKGVLLRDAAKKVGVSYGVAAKACREAGVVAPRPKRPLGPDGKLKPMAEVRAMRLRAAKIAVRAAIKAHKKTRMRVQEKTKRFAELYPESFGTHPGARFKDQLGVKKKKRK